MGLNAIQIRLRYVLRMFIAWVKEGGVTWMGSLALLAMVAIPHLLNIGALEPRFRWQGTFIEFVGILCVVFGLAKVRRGFALPSISREVLSYFLRAGKIFTKPQGVNITVNASMGLSTSVGTAVVHASPGGSVVDRVARLEEQLRSMRLDLDQQGSDIKSELKKIESKVDAESKARMIGDKSGVEILTKTMTGDVQLELVGLAYVIFGLVLSNISQELAVWFA